MQAGCLQPMASASNSPVCSLPPIIAIGATPPGHHPDSRFRPRHESRQRGHCRFKVQTIRHTLGTVDLDAFKSLLAPMSPASC